MEKKKGIESFLRNSNSVKASVQGATVLESVTSCLSGAPHTDCLWGGVGVEWGGVGGVGISRGGAQQIHQGVLGSILLSPGMRNSRTFSPLQKV